MLDACENYTSNKRMRNWILIILAAGCFLYWKHSRGPSDAPIAAAKSPAFRELVTSTSCEGKEKCLIVYVTPWCPACEQMSPYLLKIQEKSKNDPELGIKMIVGQERSPGGNQKIADRYGDTTVIDLDLSVHQMLNVKYYPTILLVRQDGIISGRDNVAFEFAFRRYQLQ